jgi:hypothetical protein
MRRELYVPPQEIEEPLVLERAGTPFLLKFPKVIPEQPYLGQVFQLASLSLILTHEVVLKVGQEEAFPSILQCSLQLLRNNWVVGVWELGFQMRLQPGTEGKRWSGESTVYQDLTNPVDYRSGDTLTFAVSGVVPGNIGGPQPTKQEVREEERAEREIELLKIQGELLATTQEMREANAESSDALLEELNFVRVIQEELLGEAAEMVNAIVALEAETGEIGSESIGLLEEIRNRLEEME